MTTEEKIYKRLKEAAEKSGGNPPAASEKIWNNVATKLDNHNLKKENDYWKKGAVAAAVLLIGAFLFHYLQPDQQPIEQNKSVIATDSLFEKIQNPQQEQRLVEEVATKKEGPSKIIQNQITIQNTIVFKDSVPTIALQNDPILLENDTDGVDDTKTTVEETDKNFRISNSNRNSASIDTDFLANRKKFDAIGISRDLEVQKKDAPAVATKKDANPDLVVLNGKLSKKNKEDLDPSEFESITELTNPIYFINGEEFTEEALFGPAAKGKYVPLKKQNITSIVVLEPEKAIKIYGEKGKNGIVILTINPK